MNERIKELAEQVDKEFNSPYDRDKAIERFALLIVRECAQAMMDYGKTYAHPSAGEYQSNEFSKVIKQHFGVEEC